MDVGAAVSIQDFELGTIANSQGMVLVGGWSVSGAGDVNGDGCDDIIVGSYSLLGYAGVSFVAFGCSDGLSSNFIYLTSRVTGMDTGFQILGASPGDASGYSVSSAGDINGDGADDLIIGAMEANSLAGISYVIFGRNVTSAANAFEDIQLPTSAMAMDTGFRILGAVSGDRSGKSVSAAGDVNGDGVDDVIIGAYLARVSGLIDVGIAYVIFGHRVSSAANAFGDIQLTTTPLAATIGFRILGIAAGDQCGFSVSNAGDLNGDEISDIVVACVLGSSHGISDAGISYILFGRNVSIAANNNFTDIQLPATTLQTNVGFRILGAASDDQSGFSVSSAGDINGDGISDVIIGAWQADPSYLPAGSNAGMAYVIFGRNIHGGATAFADVYLSSITTGSSEGFRIMGGAQEDRCGVNVGGVGDVNDDGVGDLIVGANFADPDANRIDAGISYVIFGRDTSAGVPGFEDINVGTTTWSTFMGFRILGSANNAQSGYLVTGKGDYNGDTVNDILVGAYITNAVYVIYGTPAAPTSVPSAQPSSQPSVAPSLQPSRQPTSQPSRQPSAHPTVQPSAQPTNPSSQPTRQPSRIPSSQPSVQPSLLPSRQPTGRPTSQPSKQPSSQPSLQPFQQPTTQPSGQPSVRPSVQPTGQPSRQPTIQPTILPTCQPTLQPMAQPSNQPSACPTKQPNIAPSSQPSSQPSTCPSSMPTSQPTRQPSTSPTSGPSVQPSIQPSVQPTSSPSTRPTMQPSGAPTVQPSTQPSYQPRTPPTVIPTMQPSAQPASKPSSQPLGQPTFVPSNQPSQLPTEQPSTQPSQQPFMAPSSQPLAAPSSQPSSVPSSQPSKNPTLQPSTQPSLQPSSAPSTCPSNQPSQQPTVQPVAHPSSQPLIQPSLQPLTLPTAQPTSLPTGLPTDDPFAGSWVSTLNNAQSVSALNLKDGDAWVCGRGNASAPCTVINSLAGTPTAEYSFPWAEVTAVEESSRGTNRFVIIGRSKTLPDVDVSVIATCSPETGGLFCRVSSFQDTNFAAVSYVPFPNKFVYIGAYSIHPMVSVAEIGSTDIKSYVYAAKTLKTLVLSHAMSPPTYVGSFLAGTGVTIAGAANCIIVGTLRTDSGSLTALSLAPIKGSILNSVDLVNAMALEYVNPDSFIAGGLQLSDSVGTSAYLLRVNALFGTIKYSMRFRASIAGNVRKLLGEPVIPQSTTRGMVLVDASLYAIVDLVSNNTTSMSMLKINPETGDILQQVHISSPNASLFCTKITAAPTGLFLYIACRVQYSGLLDDTVVISTDQLLSFTKLPIAFVRSTNNRFQAESMKFQSFKLAVAATNVLVEMVRYNFSTADGPPSLLPSVAPTQRPSQQPSSAPSGLPSSSPTAAPSVSPQPTSHPSSSGPTNTYKPTIKPTQQPSARPSRAPTRTPSGNPTTAPTVRPSAAPSARPSTQPSVTFTIAPTRSPSQKPSCGPSLSPSFVSTHAPTAVLSVDAEVASSDRKESNLVLVIGGSVIGGFLALWCGNWLLKWLLYTKQKLAQKVRLRRELEIIRLLCANQPSHSPHLPLHPSERVQQVQADFNMDCAFDANKQSTIGANAERPRSTPRGAYAMGKPIASDAGGSEGSSSVVLSSLHSSEMSDISYSVYSNDFYLPSLSSKSRDNNMEEGSASNGVDEDSGKTGSNDACSYEESDGGDGEGSASDVEMGQMSDGASSMNTGCER